ncbi:hypothetical protein V6615_16490 [Oscillospiraceae bacterium PP1C4]
MIDNNLFGKIKQVPIDKQSVIFKLINNDKNYLPVKLMLEELYSTYKDVDGNFIEQFQTTGFNQRIFELYIWAMLNEMNFNIDRSYQYPDFMATKNGIEVAIEVTTATGEFHKDGGIVFNNIKRFLNSDIKRLTSYNDDISLKFSSSILSKLRKKYWIKDHCRNKPFIIAVEGFFDDFVQFETSNPLLSILFGLEIVKGTDDLFYNTKKDFHIKGEKKIPSGLFFKPSEEWADMDNVSAIIFSNAGTLPKFRRMGWKKGYYNQYQIIKRSGLKFNVNNIYPDEFSFTLDKPTFKESWSDEIVVIHNPNAIHPLSHNYFSNCMNIWLQEGELNNSRNKNCNYVICSNTEVVAFKKHSTIIDISIDNNVEKITKSEFEKHILNSNSNKSQMEFSWYKNKINKKMGVIYSGREFEYFYLYKIFTTKENCKSYKCCKKSEKYKDLATTAKSLFKDLNI